MQVTELPGQITRSQVVAALEALGVRHGVHSFASDVAGIRISYWVTDALDQRVLHIKRYNFADAT